VSLKKALQWFYALEVNQVALYKMQAALAAREVDKRMFAKAAEIEAAHVENMLTALRRRGWEPVPFTPLAQATGAAAGLLTGMKLQLALQADIRLENRAMRDYLQLIAACPDGRLRETLWSNCLDESLHTEWFKSRLREEVDQLREGRRPPD
jgi:bacterioferritin